MRSVFSDQEVGRLLQRYLDGEIDELRARQVSPSPRGLPALCLYRLGLAKSS
jgi:hypothetical protein